MYLKIIPKFPDHCLIFTEVIAKKNIKQTGRQIYPVQIKKIFKTESPIFSKKINQNQSSLRKNIDEQTLQNVHTDELYNLLLWKVG